MWEVFFSSTEKPKNRKKPKAFPLLFPLILPHFPAYILLRGKREKAKK
jgi:hypothetical protein